MSTSHVAFLAALILASIGFVAGAAYFFHLPRGLSGAEQARTVNRNAISNRKVITWMATTIGIVIALWLVLGTIAITR